jgi:hypothetical protein
MPIFVRHAVRGQTVNFTTVRAGQLFGSALGAMLYVLLFAEE